ncbi:hypothetical protein ATANTOWER_032120 [Ataeniobius toweri]|uniref:Uncharacterized protein n=1 Tax=Ataeniobius toweri TaxID=208326 RepID=A0ABU7AL24_9TELE|nr:hypothetical protein [Ataeniobius toweri]
MQRMHRLNAERDGEVEEEKKEVERQEQEEAIEEDAVNRGQKRRSSLPDEWVRVEQKRQMEMDPTVMRGG